MQNNNPNDYLQEDGIDLIEIFKLLINSKKLIIIITLIITTLGAIYAYQKVPEYKSTALIEIGNYYNPETNEQKLIEPTSTLIQELTINFIHKEKIVGINSGNLLIKFIEGRLFEISIKTPSSVTSKNLLNEIIIYIQNRHSNLVTNVSKNLSYKIESINNQIEVLSFDEKRVGELEFLMQQLTLTQDKKNLELKLEFLMQENIAKTQLIGKIRTTSITSAKGLIIFLSFIFGLLLSIVIVLIINSLKANKEA
jgi:hypothetical protein